MSDQIGGVRYVDEADWDTVDRLAIVAELRADLGVGPGAPVEVVVREPRSWPETAQVLYGAPPTRAGSIAIKTRAAPPPARQQSAWEVA